MICDHLPEHPLTENLTAKPVRVWFSKDATTRSLLSSQEPDKPPTLQSCSSSSLHSKEKCRQAVAEEPPERVFGFV